MATNTKAKNKEPKIKVQTPAKAKAAKPLKIKLASETKFPQVYKHSDYALDNFNGNNPNHRFVFINKCTAIVYNGNTCDLICPDQYTPEVDHKFFQECKDVLPASLNVSADIENDYSSADLLNLTDMLGITFVGKNGPLKEDADTAQELPRTGEPIKPEGKLFKMETTCFRDLSLLAVFKMESSVQKHGFSEAPWFLKVGNTTAISDIWVRSAAGEPLTITIPPGVNGVKLRLKKSDLIQMPVTEVQ